MKVGFTRIFWGLLFVVLDIRMNSIDWILPDFVGYILIASGLSALVQYHQWFRTARLVAIILIFVSLTSLVEVKVDAQQVPRLRREWISTLTGELTSLLPQQVNSASLMRITRSGTEIDANRSHNPTRDEDRILGEYSDGTVVLILRYGSSDEVLQAMDQKSKAEYSSAAIWKRGETDETFRAPTISFPHGSSSYGRESKTSAYSNVAVKDRVIQQWWNRGWSWWNPISWGSEGGWSSRLLYIVEGHRASAEDYKFAFAGNTHSAGGITIDPLFPVATIGYLLDTFLIWGICSGIIALALSSNNFELMQIAEYRRNFYMALSLLGVIVSIMSFVAPEAILSFLDSTGSPLLVIYVLFLVTSVLLIMGLVRKASHIVK
jgi:hypothetical protein